MTDDHVRRRRRLLVFVHIPKTAGTPMRNVLRVNEPGTGSLASNVFKGGGGVSRAAIERFRTTDLKGVGLVRGHLPLGVREYLPRSREVACFTLLREPVDRLLSHYFAIRADGGGTGGLPQFPEGASLEDALDRGYVHDNLHTRMLSGIPDPFGDVDDEMLERAKHNLSDGLVFFGLAERFDESLVLAKRRLGLRTILYRSNGRVNASRPRGDDVPAPLRRAAEQANRHDIKLYRHALRLFDDVDERRELEFQVEVAALRAARAEGEIDLDVPAPAGFGGDARAWRLLLDAKATGMRLEHELAVSRMKAVGSARDKGRLRGDDGARAAGARTGAGREAGG